MGLFSTPPAPSPVLIGHRNLGFDTVDTAPQKVKTPPVLRKVETSASMIDSLAHSVRSGGDGADHAGTLQVLIDIATLKEVNWRKGCEISIASHYAEKKLLDLYRAPGVSSTTRDVMIKQLAESHAIIARRSNENEGFAMPVALAHLVAQHAYAQIARQETGVALEAGPMEGIKSALIDATGLGDQLIDGTDIADPERPVTVDEMVSGLLDVPCTYVHEIDLSKEVSAKDRTEDMTGLLHKAQNGQMVIAPLLMGDHFMLMAVEKSPKTGRFNVIVANTKEGYDEIGRADLEALPDASRDDINLTEIQNASLSRFKASVKKEIQDSADGKELRIIVRSAHLQGQAINSSGPLVWELARRVSEASKARDFKILRTIDKFYETFNLLPTQNQKDAVMAWRSKMIGDAAEWHNESRFLP
jgi:hypothetical protein